MVLRVRLGNVARYWILQDRTLLGGVEKGWAHSCAGIPRADALPTAIRR